MNIQIPITRELLLIGGGHTHALVLRMWGMNPLPGVRVTVINPGASAPYSGMLPGFVAGHYRRDELDIDLVRLARFAGARLVLGRAVKIDSSAQRVTLSDGRILPYHVAALDIGVTSDMPDLPGFAEHAIPAKPLGEFAHQWAAFRQNIAKRQSGANAAVIGGGVAGVELTLAMAHALTDGSTGLARLALIDSAQILSEMASSRRDYLRTQLGLAGVQILENAQITSLEMDRIKLKNGADIQAEFIVGAAGARAQNWLADSALNLQDGYVAVDETLRSTNDKSIFATGDCAYLCHEPRPKAGLFAVRQAPVLFANLQAALSGGKSRPFHPQRDYLKLISLGEKSALAEKWGIMFHGRTVWRLKDRIDRKFMDQFTNLAPMPPRPRPTQLADGAAQILDQAPLCGGCGSKIAGSALKNALGSLPHVARPDVLQGPGDDAAILTGPNGGFQVISTDHSRAFSNDPAMMARIAAIHALGDIWAMGADPQSALANITLPRLSPELQQGWLQEIMAAAAKVFDAQGAAIIGGHSASGAELSIGFTVTGLCATRPITKSGANSGDRMILTKPIGTGVILAAEMALQARGDWVVAAFESMNRSQGKIAGVLGCANAMTDVTGFGLAGHLGEIVQSSGVGMTLNLNDVPLLEGARELAETGVRSSIFDDNRALLPDLAVPQGAVGDLLFDPQTAGGLLAAVPANAVAKTMYDLNKLGCDAAVIGHCTDQADGFKIV